MAFLGYMETAEVETIGLQEKDSTITEDFRLEVNTCKGIHLMLRHYVCSSCSIPGHYE